ncbi:MAG TPA: DUF488 domain-containing protein [Terriglobia bacterium]|nr:DUF488 domain-containing protein [Terriglobia bacterium]
MADSTLMPESRNYQPLFTVGHSNLDFSAFVKLLTDWSVNLLIDVRSQPRSGRFPQFSQPGFEKMMENAGMRYLFLGDELGGRPDDPDAYRSDGVVDYRARRKSYAFQSGIERVLSELDRAPCALLCAEEDPLECHRFLMICPELVQMGIQPIHIRKGSRIERQEDAENRLLGAHGFGGVAASTLFPQARTDALEEAYELQASKFAYRVSPLAVERW